MNPQWPARAARPAVCRVQRIARTARAVPWPASASAVRFPGGRPSLRSEVVSKTLGCEPRRWKIIEHVREKFSCRDCEAITEAPAPSHPIPRGFAGPSLLAMVLVNKFLLHQPLKITHLHLRDRHNTVRRRRPYKTTPLQFLRKQASALAIVPDHPWCRRALPAPGRSGGRRGRRTPASANSLAVVDFPIPIEPVSPRISMLIIRSTARERSPRRPRKQNK